MLLDPSSGDVVLATEESALASFTLTDEDTVERLATAYEAECIRSRTVGARFDLDHVVPQPQLGEVSPRWILLHMIEETAHHAGILRELTDDPELSDRSTTRMDGHVKTVYSDGDHGDGEADPEAVPGLRPNTEGDDATSFTLDVDGEEFVIRSDNFAGTSYTWLSGPNRGYGFGVSPAPELSLDEHRENIRSFLAMVDPNTGCIE